MFLEFYPLFDFLLSKTLFRVNAFPHFGEFSSPPPLPRNDLNSCFPLSMHSPWSWYMAWVMLLWGLTQVTQIQDTWQILVPLGFYGCWTAFIFWKLSCLLIFNDMALLRCAIWLLMYCRKVIVWYFSYQNTKIMILFCLQFIVNFFSKNMIGGKFQPKGKTSPVHDCISERRALHKN